MRFLWFNQFTIQTKVWPWLRTKLKASFGGCGKVVPSHGVYWIIWLGSWTTPVPKFTPAHYNQKFRVEPRHQYLQMTHEAIDIDRQWILQLEESGEPSWRSSQGTGSWRIGTGRKLHCKARAENDAWVLRPLDRGIPSHLHADLLTVTRMSKDHLVLGDLAISPFKSMTLKPSNFLWNSSETAFSIYEA